jgi:hypothetical protein
VKHREAIIPAQACIATFVFVVDRTVQKGRMQGARQGEERGVLSRTLSDEAGGQRNRRPFFNGHSYDSLLILTHESLK